MASFMGNPLRGSLEPSQVPAQASQLQGAVAPGELIDPLGGQGADGAGVDPGEGVQHGSVQGVHEQRAVRVRHLRERELAVRHQLRNTLRRI